MTLVNVRPTGLVLTVVLTPTQDIVTLSVTVAALALLPLTAFNAYLILIVIATQLVSVTTTGREMTVAYVSTWKHVIQFVTTAMDVLVQHVRTVLPVMTTQSATLRDIANVRTDSTETTVIPTLAHVIQCAAAMSIVTDTT
jgi:hypothetical protein